MDSGKLGFELVSLKCKAIEKKKRRDGVHYIIDFKKMRAYYKIVCLFDDNDETDKENQPSSAGNILKRKRTAEDSDDSRE